MTLSNFLNQYFVLLFLDGEEYDKQLQRLMQECLPNILVEVVEQRPHDPIAFIANALYRYRVSISLWLDEIM